MTLLPSNAHSRASQVDRRSLLLGGGVVAGGLLAYPFIRNWMRPRSATFVARNQNYDGNLVSTIRDGLLASGFTADDIRGKRVLLKPNLVEPTREAPHMTTHPAVIVSAAEVFRGWGAIVTVGEAPGHVRDTELALIESGVMEALDDARLPFADLNYEASEWVKNRGRASKLKGMYFPQSILEADLVVSLPKMKTHHWVGVTAAMKNLYGTLPGIRYGWPKNVLHFAGIPQTVYDINASLPQTIAIVDGIDCMEGDGPILGTPKHMGLMIIGTNLAAVDSTVCRLMGIRPERISYLALAANRLGPIESGLIEQRGEVIETLSQPFEIVDAPHLRHLRG